MRLVNPVRLLAALLAAAMLSALAFVAVPATSAGAFQPALATCVGGGFVPSPVATIVGTPGDDVLEGTPGDDVIVGLGGNDTINGNGGDDIICAGDGDDVIDGGSGGDVIDGEDGDDTINGSGGSDRLVGSAGNDTLKGGGGPDVLHGGGGPDVLRGGGGADYLEGDDGADDLRGGKGADRVIGGAGADDVRGNGGDDVLDGNGGNDKVRGGKGADALGGGDGDDKLFGQAGADRMFGGVSDDVLRGGTGDDVLVGGPGVDTLIGGADNDACEQLNGETTTACESTDVPAARTVTITFLDAFGEPLPDGAEVTFTEQIIEEQPLGLVTIQDTPFTLTAAVESCAAAQLDPELAGLPCEDTTQTITTTGVEVATAIYDGSGSLTVEVPDVLVVAQYFTPGFGCNPSLFETIEPGVLTLDVQVPTLCVD